MKDWRFWLQLFISSLLPLTFSGGLVYALSLFKERLPDWSYNLIVALMYVVWILVFVVLVVTLIRLAFGDWVNKVRYWLQQRAKLKATITLLEEWRDKFSELTRLLGEVTANDWKASEAQSINYLRLHEWFGLHRSAFLPSWRSFQYYRIEPANVAVPFTEYENEVFQENHNDPFSVFYQPMNLNMLVDSIRYRGTDATKYILRKLCELTEECVNWTQSRRG